MRKEDKDWLERLMLEQITAVGLPEPTQQYKAVPKRRFRFDFAWPEHNLLLEVHGGEFANGRHTRGTGFTKDREKMNLAQIEGYCVLEVTGCQVRDGIAISWVEMFFKKRLQQ